MVQLIEKQRRAVAVIKMALLNAGITGRSVSAGFDSWTYPAGRVENFAVFVSSPDGSNIEPYYEKGETIVEAVRKMIDSIKGRANSAKADDRSEEAPF